MGLPAKQLAPAAPAPAAPLPFLLQPGPVRPPRVGAVGYGAALSQNTGATWGAESWLEGQQRQAVLADQTRCMADALERNGIRARLPSDILMLGEVTGCSSQTESWRPIRFLPAVAQRERKPILNALKMWGRAEGGRLRYAVVTAGTRVPLGVSGDRSLAARQSQHTRAISRWAHDAHALYGVAVQFRATEMTVSPEGVHLHSNVLYRLAKVLPPETWAEFLAWSHQRLGAHWQDCGEVKNMDEVVKYALKPAEVAALDDQHLVWLYENLFAKKLCQPMGAFALWLFGLSQDRLKVAMVVDPAVPGERRKGRLRLVEKPRRDPKDRKASTGDDEDSTLGDDVPCIVPDDVEVSETVEGPPEAPPGENVLIARTLPMARYCPWSEPVTLVQGYTETPVTADGVRRLEIIRERRAEARAWWDANGAPAPATAMLAAQSALGTALKVHTGSPTVQVERAAPPPRKLVTMPDGCIVDSETGEVAFTPPKRLPPPDDYAWMDEVVAQAARDSGRVARMMRSCAALAAELRGIEVARRLARKRRGQVVDPDPDDQCPF